MTPVTKKAWSYCTGERGRNRVRVFPDARTGLLYLDFRGGSERARMPLGHRDRDEAKRQADDLAARLARPDTRQSGRVTLAELFDNYVREVTPTKGAARQRHDRRATKWILDIVGPAKLAASLTHRDAARFVAERLRRGDQRRDQQGDALGRRLNGRGIAENVSLWQAVLNWAVNAGWLDRNPLRGFRVKQGEAPRRPILTAKEYTALLTVADRVPEGGPLAALPSLFKLALVLTHETGHRISAVRQLRWADVNLETATATWRSEYDKMSSAHVTPLTPEAVAVLREARRARPMIGDGWLFPSPMDTDHVVTREVLYGWWLEAERLAEVAHVEGRAWHSLRRKFATDLKHTPLKDLCALGGWKTHMTLLTCYQQADPVTMREALAKRSSLAM